MTCLNYFPNFKFIKINSKKYPNKLNKKKINVRIIKETNIYGGLGCVRWVGKMINSNSA